MPLTTELNKNITIVSKILFVSGCYDLLYSGHEEFFQQALQFGDLYVGIGSDATVLHYKNHKTLYPEQERLFMVKSIKYVKDAFINQGADPSLPSHKNWRMMEKSFKLDK